MAASNLDGVVYPFDPTGTKPSNLVTSEQHIVTAVNWGDYNVLVPKCGPYFADTLKLSFRDVNGIPYPLTEGRDWYSTHQFVSASRACAKDVFGSITLLRNDLVGVLTIDEYQTIGGDWVLNEQQVAHILADSLHNPRITTFEQVIELPYAFPVIDHEWNLIDMVGMKDVKSTLDLIYEAILAKGEGGLAAHIANHFNPHNTTADQLNLGKVPNFAPANDSEAVDPTNNNTLMTPRAVSLAISALVGSSFYNHAQNKSNPHGTDAHQTGTYFSSEIDTLLAKKVDKTGVAYDTDRFSGMNSLQYKAYVLQGTAANAMKVFDMTLAQLKMEIQGGASADSDKLAGMTIDEVKDYILQGNASNAMKLNGRTDVQTKAWVLQGQASDSAALAGRSISALTTEILQGTAANSNKFGGMTPDEFKLSISTGTASNSLRFDGRAFNEAMNEILKGTAANSSKFGGMSTTEFASSVLSGKAADSILFNGMTPAQFADSVMSTYKAADTYMFDGRSSTEWVDIIQANAENHALQLKHLSATGEAAGSRWCLLGNYMVPKTIGQTSGLNDFQILVAGGEGETGSSGLYLVRGGVRSGAMGTFAMSVQDLGGVATGATFGYVKTERDAGTWNYSVYIKVPNNRSVISVTELAGAPFEIPDNLEVNVLPAQPVGWIDSPVYGGGITTKDEFNAYKAQVDAAFGQIATAFDQMTQLIKNGA